MGGDNAGSVEPLRIGILETGSPPGDLAQSFGRYDAMMAALLGPGFVTTTFDVRAGHLPDDPAAFAGFIVTGSAAGVYEDLPWIAPLRDFLRQARGRTRLVGICFGHQIMAEAFGGKVVRSDKGWGIGLNTYRIEARPDWIDDASSFTIPASHQDQVVALPPGARIIAASPFAPMAGLAYADGTAMSFQGHPEFDPAYARALLELRRDRLDPQACARAMASLDEPNDSARVNGWIRTFLRG